MNNAHWEITNKCNLKCKHCIVDNLNYQEDLSIGKNKDIIDILSEKGVRHILFSAKEPFMYANFIELLKYTKTNNIYSTVVTNGILLDENTIKTLFDLNIYMIVISIEGLSSKTNDYVRGNGSFNHVKKILQLFKKYNRIKKNTILISISINLTNYNIKEMENLLDFAEENDIYQVSIGKIEPNGKAKNYKDLLAYDENIISNITKSIIERYKVYSNKFILSFKYVNMYALIYYNTVLDTNISNSIPGCSFHKGNAFIMPNGDLNLCPLLMDDNIVDESILKVGNIFNDDIENKYINFNKKDLIAYKDNDICKSCIFNEKCELCLLITNDSNRFNSMINKCDFFMKKIDALANKIFKGELQFRLRKNVVIKKGINIYYFSKSDYSHEKDKLNIEYTSVNIDDLINCMIKYEFVSLKNNDIVTKSILKKLLYNDYISVKN